MSLLNGAEHQMAVQVTVTGRDQGNLCCLVHLNIWIF